MTISNTFCHTFKSILRSLTCATSALLLATACQAESSNLPYQERPPEDDIIYFVLPDRFENGTTENDTGGITGNKFDHGFDPTHKGFYHGGDLKGLIERLDYLEDLGITAIWFAPIFKNKPVQGAEPHISAGYHGYWIQDFTTIDPHFGTPAEFKKFVDAAHARNMKVYMDIVTNHTADIISYRECHDPDWTGKKVDDNCAYRSVNDYPYTSTPQGKAINTGFIGDDAPHQTQENFSRLTRPDFAYTPYIRDEEKHVKVPAWLNDPIYYHNRGESAWEGESSVYGDFAGLDDVFTEHPRVVKGFIDVYKQWISDFRIDGFRADTVKHVNSKFWQAFVPAILSHAKSEGIDNFYIFGEVYSFDVSTLAKHATLDRFPAILDFAMQGAIENIVTGKAGPSQLTHVLEKDVLYPGGNKTANRLPTFVGNHDMGRIGHFIDKALPDISEKEALQRSQLAHGLMIFSRGVPVLYYGDEQGFIGDGHDQDARETLFPSRVASYNDNNMLGTDATAADDNFDRSHPLYRAIATMNAVYRQHAALRRGDQQILYAGDEQGILAFSRTDGDEQIVVIANTATTDSTARVELPKTMRKARWQTILGDCPAPSNAKGELQVTAKPLSIHVCKAK